MSRLLWHGVAVQAQARPDATAIVASGLRTNYGSLEARSNQLARLLAEAGCRAGDRVGILMPKVPDAIVAMLGTLKADAICVPLDPASPALRLARIVESSDCRCILVAGPLAHLLSDVLAAATLRQPPLVGWLDDAPPIGLDARPAFTSSDLDAQSTAPRPTISSDSNVAQLLFTSGSTGMPKGVMITHRNVMQFLQWAIPHFRITPTDRLSQHPPFHFDLSTFDIYGTLWAGASLYLVPPDLNLLPHKLAHFIREAGLTQWFSVPSVLNLMAKFGVVHDNDFPSLRRVIWCGEAIPTPTVIHWMRRLPHVRFTNLYGPTEATIASSHYTLPGVPPDPRDPIPIGRACDGEELMVLDSHLQPVPAGEVGDLYIRGVGLSPGYWRDIGKTRSVFLPYGDGANPQDRVYRTGDLARRGVDGLFHFLGRADTQIKSRGYRIELGEIEAALSCLPGLRESAVVAIESEGFEGAMICCAYAPAPDTDISPAGLRERLAALVPGYMLPARWMRYDELPKNGNGKIDRPRLKDGFARAELRLVTPTPAVPPREMAKAHGGQQIPQIPTGARH